MSGRSAIKRRTSRLGPMARLGLSMMFHDRAKLAGTLMGVVFATVLMSQQLGVFLGLLHKNTQYVDATEADLWIVPPATQTALGGPELSLSAMVFARTVAGVAWAEPLLMGGASMQRPDGGREAVMLVGTTRPRMAGGPWNLVVGDASALADPDVVIFEDVQRKKLGDLDYREVRELSGRRVVAGGFTWGLVPFGPGYAFADYETARGILRIPEDQASFILIGLEPGADAAAVQQALRARLGGDVEVLTKREYQERIVTSLIAAQLGISFGTSTAFALIVGFVIVALSMFSAVVDNMRELGTLKAVGATTFDLTKLLVVQALVYALIGTTIGLFLATRMAEGIRSANLVLVLPPEILFGSYGVMILLCVAASGLAVLRVRNIEPGMVFR